MARTPANQTAADLAEHPSRAADRPDLQRRNLQPKPPAPTREYLLLSGRHVYTDPDTGETITAMPGAKIPLTENQFANFADKFQDPNVAKSIAEAQKENANKLAELEKLRLENAALQSQLDQARLTTLPDDNPNPIVDIRHPGAPSMLANQNPASQDPAVTPGVTTDLVHMRPANPGEQKPLVQQPMTPDQLAEAQKNQTSGAPPPNTAPKK